MPDRATHLARVLLGRLRHIEGDLLDGDAPDETEERERRVEMVEKVLVAEAGITEGMAARLIAEALPRLNPEAPIPDRDFEEVAAFLREQRIV